MNLSLNKYSLYKYHRDKDIMIDAIILVFYMKGMKD
jgi:hypothetical protein